MPSKPCTIVSPTTVTPYAMVLLSLKIRNLPSPNPNVLCKRRWRMLAWVSKNKNKKKKPCTIHQRKIAAIVHTHFILNPPVILPQRPRYLSDDEQVSCSHYRLPCLRKCLNTFILGIIIYKKKKKKSCLILFSLFLKRILAIHFLPSKLQQAGYCCDQ